MKEFEKWYYYVKSEGRLWPSFGRYATKEELLIAKETWRTALKWVKQTMLDNADSETPTFFDVEKELEDE